jgi:type I restriction enzyme R subunit
LAAKAGGAITRTRHPRWKDAAAKEGLPQRALLSLATGAGKTFIAVNLLKRMADAGQMKRALFVCDRDELRNQATTTFRMFLARMPPRCLLAIRPGTSCAHRHHQTLNVGTADADANFTAISGGLFQPHLY